MQWTFFSFESLRDIFAFLNNENILFSSQKKSWQEEIEISRPCTAGCLQELNNPPIITLLSVNQSSRCCDEHIYIINNDLRKYYQYQIRLQHCFTHLKFHGQHINLHHVWMVFCEKGFSGSLNDQINSCISHHKEYFWFNIVWSDFFFQRNLSFFLHWKFRFPSVDE